MLKSLRLRRVSILVFCLAFLATSCPCISIPRSDSAVVTVLALSWIVMWISTALAVLAEKIFKKIENAGINVNPRLVEDYIDGSVSNVVLALIGFSLGVLYMVTRIEQLVAALVSILAAQFTVALIVAAGLATIIRLLRKLRVQL